MTEKVSLYDVVCMKKEHPCKKGEKKFQIVKLGADIKIKCLGCGNFIIMTRDDFNHKVKKIVSHEEKEIIL